MESLFVACVGGLSNNYIDRHEGLREEVFEGYFLADGVVIKVDAMRQAEVNHYHFAHGWNRINSVKWIHLFKSRITTSTPSIVVI